MTNYITWFEDPASSNVAQVGGKNAGLGEMFRNMASQGIAVPPGFACTADAYWRFVDGNGLREKLQQRLLGEDDATALAAVAREMRQLFLDGAFPPDLRDAIVGAYRELGRREGSGTLHVAVRSSATAEDLPQASFAGQQESYLNISGERALLNACKQCFASLFTERAMVYRRSNGFDDMKVALSICIQKMVRSDLACSGVMFTLDTESGFPEVVLINASYGLGENIVKGVVNPDELLVFKPMLADASKRPILRKKLGGKEKTLVLAKGESPTKNRLTPKAKRNQFALSDDETLQLARWACLIEQHMSRREGKATPMDIEWAKDGDNGRLYIVQARPETVHSSRAKGALTTYKLREHQAKPILKGQSVGEAIVTGKVRVVATPSDIQSFNAGDILVAAMTDPDWTPLMKKAAGVITDRGGRTCHAAIVGRELGIPTLVGTHLGTRTLRNGQQVTLSLAQGEEGLVFDGALAFDENTAELSTLPSTKTKLMINLAQPGAAFSWWKLPTDGIGLCRLEFIVSSEIQVHPMAIAHPERVSSGKARRRIAELTTHYETPERFFVETLARGVATIAASQYPKPAIVRMSDFKTNEYRQLLGGEDFEPEEENPMIGFRGASRYYDERYRDGFALECQAMKFARETLGLDNIILMVPFCRTLEEADRVLEVMAQNGLTRGQNGLEVYVMCEIPANVILTEEFAERFDGFSIGSNDLTQLVLGVDRDSALLAKLFDESNPAVTRMIKDVIVRAHRCGRHVGLCGQAPSDREAFAELLVDAGIDSMSLNPDSFVRVKRRVAQLEARPSKPERKLALIQEALPASNG